LWDTGATNSAITQAVVDKCGLKATGITQVQGVHGLQQAETYLVNVWLPNKVMFMSLRVTKGEMGGVDVLIGMDVIAVGDFSVTNCQGFTKFSYRTPSVKHIDYVEEAQTIQATLKPNRASRRRAKKGHQ